MSMRSVLSRVIEPKNAKMRSVRFTNRALKAMLIPLVIEQFLQLIVGLADTMMVSYAGEAVVSGVSLDATIYTIFSMVFNALATGGAVVVSQYIGKGDKERADLSASQIYFCSGLFSLASTALMLIFGSAVLGLLYRSVESDVMEACRVYLRIVTISFPAAALYNAGAAVYRSMGKTRTTMIVSIIMNLINVAGNAIGVFALHAGAAGVAWPTTIAWYFAAIAMTALCFNRRNQVSLQAKFMLVPSGEVIRQILHLAVPNVIENGLFQVSKVVLAAVLATFGTAQIAANGIGQTIWSFSAMMSLVTGPACITFVGQCMGAGAVEEADYYSRKLTRLTVFLALAWNVVVLALLPALVQLYDISAETERLLYIIVIIHCIFAGTVQPVGSPLGTCMRAAGDIRFTMFTSLFCTLVVRVSLTFLLCVGLGFGVIGLTAAMVTDWTVKMIILLIRYRSGKWKNFKVIS